MRKEETVRIIPERKETVVTYYGNCSDCGCQQISAMNEEYVDILCSTCYHKQKMVQRQQFLDTYVGCRILKIDDIRHEIIVKTKTGRIYAIASRVEDYMGQCDGCTCTFESEEIVEGDIRLDMLKNNKL